MRDAATVSAETVNTSLVPTAGSGSAVILYSRCVVSTYKNREKYSVACFHAIFSVP